MRRRALAGAGAAALGAATAIAALVIGTTTAVAAPGPSSAYGVFVSSIIDPPRPAVESTDGTEQSDSLAELPENDLLGLEVAAVSAGDSTASSKLLGVQVVPGAEAPEQLDPVFDGLQEACANLPDNPSPVPPPEGLPDDLQEACMLIADPPAMDALLSVDLIEVSCEGDSANFNLAGVRLLGQELPIPSTDPNTMITPEPLADVISVTINKQSTGDNGLNVQGLVVSLGGGEVEIVLASATCGTATEPPDKPTATAPAPVTTGLPVTG